MQCWSRQGDMTKEKAKFVKARDNVELVFHDTGNKTNFLVEFNNKDSELPFASITCKQKRYSSVYGVVSIDNVNELQEHFKELAEQSFSRLDTMLGENVAEPKFTRCSLVKAGNSNLSLPATVKPLLPLMLVIALLTFFYIKKPKR